MRHKTKKTFMPIVLLNIDTIFVCLWCLCFFVFSFVLRLFCFLFENVFYFLFVLFCFVLFLLFLLFCCLFFVLFCFFFFRGRGYQLDWTLKFYGRKHKLAVTVQCLLHRWRNICLKNRNLFLSLLSYLRHLLVFVRYLWEHEDFRYKRTYFFYPKSLTRLVHYSVICL